MSDTNTQLAGPVAFGLPAEVHPAAQPSVEKAALELLSVVRVSMPKEAAETRSFVAYVALLAVLAAGDLGEEDVQCAIGHATTSAAVAIAERGCGHVTRAVMAFNDQATANAIFFQDTVLRPASAPVVAKTEGSALQ